MSKRTLLVALAAAMLLSGCVVVQPELAETHAAAEEDGGASQEQIFQVVTATYLLDGAGLHDIDVSINEEDTIEPSFAGSVRRIHGVLAVTAWPAELHESAEALLGTLAALAEALADDDTETAGPLATAAHDQAHDLSHDVEHWLAAHGHGDADGH